MVCSIHCNVVAFYRDIFSMCRLYTPLWMCVCVFVLLIAKAGIIMQYKVDLAGSFSLRKVITFFMRSISMKVLLGVKHSAYWTVCSHEINCVFACWWSETSTTEGVTVHKMRRPKHLVAAPSRPALSHSLSESPFQLAIESPLPFISSPASFSFSHSMTLTSSGKEALA